MNVAFYGAFATWRRRLPFSFISVVFVVVFVSFVVGKVVFWFAIDLSLYLLYAEIKKRRKLTKWIWNCFELDEKSELKSCFVCAFSGLLLSGTKWKCDRGYFFFGRFVVAGWKKTRVTISPRPPHPLPSPINDHISRLYNARGVTLKAPGHNSPLLPSSSVFFLLLENSPKGMSLAVHWLPLGTEPSTDEIQRVIYRVNQQKW